MRKILGFTLIIVLFVLVLKFGGFSLKDFSNQIHLRDPGTVLSPLTENIPKGHEVVGDIPTGNGGGYTFDPNARLDGSTGNNENTPYSPIINGTTSNEENNSELPNESTDTSTTENSTVENKEDSNVESENKPEDKPKEESKTETESKEEPKEESKTDPKNKEETTQEANINTKTWTFTIGDKTLELTPENTASFLKWLETQFKDNSTITYTDSSDTSSNPTSNTTSNEEISKLISSINTVDALPTTADYNRANFEKPVKSYTLDGKKVNRNDYAWKTSPYFNEKDFTYTCPYTGKVIKDLDDNKEDKDFGSVDFDHIIPLKSAYLRGASEWTDEQRNAYAYDQSVGVDVLNSANRSKSDKGPAEWLPDINRGSYCYSWLVICQKYNLSMTQEEIDICNAEIDKAIKNGEPVVFMGGHN